MKFRGIGKVDCCDGTAVPFYITGAGFTLFAGEHHSCCLRLPAMHLQLQIFTPGTKMPATSHQLLSVIVSFTLHIKSNTSGLSLVYVFD